MLHFVGFAIGWLVYSGTYERCEWAPPEMFLKLGALRSLLWPYNYLYLSVTGPTRVHGGSNTAVRHDALHQLSRPVSVTTFYVSILMTYTDELTTWTRTVSTLYFALKLVQTEARVGVHSSKGLGGRGGGGEKHAQNL